jgi:hypothetical protein
MGSITLNFPQPINVSVQAGDTAYYTDDVNGVTIVKIGSILSVNSFSITVDIAASTIRPSLTSFILFSKTNDANVNSITGYYAEVQLRNDSTDKAEMSTVASEVFVSSK